MTEVAAPLPARERGRSRGLAAAALALAGIDGFSRGERQVIAGFVKMGRVRVGPGHEGWAGSLSGLIDRAFTWPEFDRWHAFFTASGVFPPCWRGLHRVPGATATVAVRLEYRQRKMELLLEWLDMLNRRPAELGHYTKRGRRARIVRQEDSQPCPVCESHNAREVGDGSDTLPPLHPGCRCVLMATMTTAPRKGRGALPSAPDGRQLC